MLKNEDEFFIFMYQLLHVDNKYTDYLLSLIGDRLDPIFKIIISENVWDHQS